ncbi:fatty acid desaturase [Antarctobacter heliothermus]|uniref:Fatty acid desaturase n=1 Tax=Antarctobacter heliothermus TaxID=74033 RepID=A0A239EZN5_9RHOB|nr:fatty acid desaturase [Antarctobacter heliothermus]SNS49921.1 Fatty acid desaturase [Antarctobacter heliothermus]
MDHKAVLAQLPADTRSALTARHDAPGLKHLATHLGAILLVGALILLRVPFWPLFMLPQGILMVFLFTLLHETVHDTPFRTHRLNRAAGVLSGALLFLPPIWFRWFHLAHHRHTQIPGKDPELAEPKPETIRAWLVHVSGLPIWISHFRTLFRNAAGRCDDDYVPKARRADVTREARRLLTLYAVALLGSLIAGSAALLWVWLIPLLLGQPFLRLYLLAEHGRCAFVTNMLENTRTTFTNRLIRWLAWNMPYHAEHHSFPAVPFHQLPALHAHMAPHLAITENGYGRFTATYVSNLR